MKSLYQQVESVQKILIAIFVIGWIGLLVYLLDAADPNKLAVYFLISVLFLIGFTLYKNH